MTATFPVETLRARLIGVAYRMLGKFADAEDAVQEAYLRWQRVDRTDVASPEAWLVRVVSRLCIDRLRNAHRERSIYMDRRPPKDACDDSLAPERRLEVEDDLSTAFLLMLECLAPEERAAFLLREAFGYSHGELAGMLHKSAVAVRQIVHRARARVRAAHPSRGVPGASGGGAIVRQFVTALRSGDETKAIARLTATSRPATRNRRRGR